MPRTPKLSDEARDSILRFLKGGLPLDTTARLTGVQEAAIRNWRAKDREFDEEVRQAMAEGEAIHVARIREAGKTNWRASAWLLERMYPERWGQPAESEIPNAPPAAVDPLAGL